MRQHLIVFASIALSLAFCKNSRTVDDIPPNKVIPTQHQIEYQQLEFIGFFHFTVNTFTDKEWGYCDENPSIFNPTELNAEQWVKAAKEAGMKQLILTAKHHDGFCLWPSKYTEHSVKNSPYKAGKGEIVKEFVDACRKYDLRPGLYLSPWDRNHPDYGKPEYITYYRNQLTELLTQYGDIYEIWFDGANGGTGYYGGAREERRIDNKTYYDWENTWALVKSLQPTAMIFSDIGPDIRWVGNEHGFAGETFWSTLNVDEMYVGSSDIYYLNTGSPQGNTWLVGECDVSIRPGWFYHAHEDTRVKSPQELLDIYYKSVGRNGTFLLNIPPDRRGLLHENDIKSLMEFRAILNETFKTDLAKNKVVSASNTRLNHAKFSVNNVVDDDPQSYWATDDSVTSAWLEIDWGKPILFDRVMLQEPIRFGQRIAGFEIQAIVNGEWKTLADGTTIGYKRLLRFDPVHASRIKIVITKSINTPAISNVGVFKASEKETL